MTIAEFDHLDTDKKKELLQRCCGSPAWVNKMLKIFPVEDLVDLLEYADEKWEECKTEDWMEAFKHHPVIGDIQSIQEEFAATAEWALDEQSGANEGPPDILRSIAEGNSRYREKFGYIFIVHAFGKTSGEILGTLQERLHNKPEDEIDIAATEQIRITKNRLEKLFA